MDSNSKDFLIRVRADIKQALSELKKLTGATDASANAAVKSGKRTEKAYEHLRIRSFKEIRREIKAVIASYNRLSRSGKLSSKELARAQKQATERVRGLKQELTGTTQGAGLLRGAIVKLTGAYIALRAAQAFKGSVTSSTLLAARNETLGVVLAVVGKNAGHTRGEMEGLVEQVKALGITTRAANVTLIKMAQLNLDIAKSTELARVAQDAAVAGQVDSSEALERLIRGIATQEVETLRRVGIIITFEREFAKFAKAAGRSVDSLSDNEKKQIALNAVLREGKKLSGAYTAAMNTAAKQLGTMTRLSKNLSEELGKVFQPPFIIAIKSSSAAMKTFTEILRGLNASLGTANYEQFSLEKIDKEITRVRKKIEVTKKEAQSTSTKGANAFLTINILKALAVNSESKALKKQLLELEKARGGRGKVIRDLNTGKVNQKELDRQARFQKAADDLTSSLKKQKNTLSGGAVAAVRYEIEVGKLKGAEENLQLQVLAAAYALDDERKALERRQKAMQDQKADADLQASLKEEIRLLGLSARAQEKARAVRSLSTTATAEQRKEIAQLAGSLFDSNQAEAIEEQLQNIQARLLQAQGKAAEAQRLLFAKEYDELIKTLEARGDEGGTALVEKLFDVEKARTQLSALEEEYRLIMDRIKLSETRITNDKDVGLIGEITARQKIVKLHRNAAAELDKLIPKMKELAGVLGPEELQKVEQFEEQVRSMSLTVDEYSKRMQSATKEGLTDFFDDVIEGSKSAGEAFEDFANTVISAVRRMLAEQLAESVMDGSAASSIGNFFASFFHDGGVVGSGGRRSRVSPLAFVGAPRYHSGGFPGLKADERPAILQTGEEVLSRSDPRNRMNARGGGVDSLKVEIINNGQDAKVSGADMKFNLNQMVATIIIDDNRRGGPIQASTGATFGLQRK